MDVPGGPSPAQDIDVTVDALVVADVLPLWPAVLGFQQAGDQDLLDPHGRLPSIWFQPLETPHPQRNRIHVDDWVPHDQAQAPVAAAITAGCHLISDVHAPAWWTLSDAEGNEADVTTWTSRRR